MFAPRFEQGSLFKILDETHGLVYEREGGTQARGGSEGGHSCEFRWSKPCSGVVLVALGRAPKAKSLHWHVAVGVSRRLSVDVSVGVRVLGWEVYTTVLSRECGQ